MDVRHRAKSLRARNEVGYVDVDPGSTSWCFFQIDLSVLFAYLVAHKTQCRSVECLIVPKGDCLSRSSCTFVNQVAQLRWKLE